MTRRTHPDSARVLAFAWAAFLLSNLIHNSFGLDPAVVPATAFAAIYLWRGGRSWIIASAVMIVLPAFAFLDVATLTATDAPKGLANHWALLAAGTLGIGALGSAIKEAL